MITLYNVDCLNIMKDIKEKSIDLILCDLPYGQLKSETIQWDNIIPFDELWESYNRIIKDNGAILLFGSGSMGVACLNTNRNFIGIEKDKKYFEIAKKRIEDNQKYILI